MTKKPLEVRKATEEEIETLASHGGGNFGWKFPDELFNGEVWAVKVANDQVQSAGNSFRNQCHATYGRRASIRLKDGLVFVRMLLDKPAPKPKKKGAK